MKKALSAILLTIIVFLFSGCGIDKQTFDVNYGEEIDAGSQLKEKYSDISWNSTDLKVAAVGVGGKIVAKGPGTAVITASNADKVLGEYTVNVTVVPATGISVSTASATVTEGETYKLSYTLSPDTASDYGISWKSSDETIATVNVTGEVCALKPGQATISVSTQDGISSSCSVTVESKLTPEEKRLIGKWDGFGGTYNGQNTLLDNLSLTVYDDMTGKLILDDATHSIKLKYIGYISDYPNFEVTSPTITDGSIYIIKNDNGDDGVIYNFSEKNISLYFSK